MAKFSILFSSVLLMGLMACKPAIKTHELFYGSPRPLVVSITIGDIESIKFLGRGTPASPSMISPNRLAVVNMVGIVKGNGLGPRIGLAYESGRKSEPAPHHRYVFLWDNTGRCIDYFPVKGSFYVKDGYEIALDNLK